MLLIVHQLSVVHEIKQIEEKYNSLRQSYERLKNSCRECEKPQVCNVTDEAYNTLVEIKCSLELEHKECDDQLQHAILERDIIKENFHTLVHVTVPKVICRNLQQEYTFQRGMLA